MGGLGLQTYGYQRESAARASVMTFLEIPFSYVLQFLMFGDLLSPLEGLGMLLVVSSGLINFLPRMTCGTCGTCVDFGRDTTEQTSDDRKQSGTGLNVEML